jgi:hypothetical protein
MKTFQTDEDEVVSLKAYKNRANKRNSGKFIERPKKERPVDTLQVIKANRCHKKSYSNLKQAKEALKSARYAQVKAQAGLAKTSHREVRYYQCENCGYGSKTAIWHLTSISLENYAMKMASFGEFTAAA